MNGRDQPLETARYPIRCRNFPRSLGVFKRRTSRDRVRLQSQPILGLSDGATLRSSAPGRVFCGVPGQVPNSLTAFL